jgi:hypothetical protein
MIQKFNQSERMRKKTSRSSARRQQRQSQLVYDNLEHRQLMATLVGNNTVTYQDVDGDTVTVAFSGRFLTAANANSIFNFSTGSVSGSNAARQQLRTINLSGLTAGGRSSITVSVVPSASGDGRANVGQILATGVDLGNVTVNGDLGRIRSGDSNARTRGLGVLSVQYLGFEGTFTGAPNLETEVVGSIRGINVTNSIFGAYIRTEAAGNIDAINIGTSLIGGTAANSGAIYSSGNIGNVSLGGSLAGSSGSVSGSLHAAGNIGNVTIGNAVFGSSGNESGSISATRVGSLSVVGSLYGGVGQKSGSINYVAGNLRIGGSIFGGSGNQSAWVQFVSPNRGNVDIAGGIVGGAGETSGNLGYGESSANRVNIGGNVQGGSGERSGQVAMPMNSLTIGGSVLGGTGSRSGSVIVGRIDSLTINGDIRGGNAFGTASLTNSGYISVVSAQTITVGGNLVAGLDGTSGAYEYNGAIVATNAIRNLTIRGNILGNSSNPFLIQAFGQESPRGRTDLAFETISITGNVTRAKLLAGVGPRGTSFNADAQVRELVVGGNWTASDFLVGVYHAGVGVYRKYTGSRVKDSWTVTSSVGRISITGSINGTLSAGDHFGFASEHILSFTRGTTPFPMTTGKSNDNRLLDTIFADVRLLEV